MSTNYDLIVIGAGPGGYVAAIRASQLGLRVACIEKEARLGGTCLRVGCIPSKALLEASERYVDAREHLGDFGIDVQGVGLNLQAMLGRKDKVVQTLTQGIDGLFKKNKITRYQGHAYFTGPGQVGVRALEGDLALSASSVLIATGSKVASLSGVEVDGNLIGTSTEALSYPAVPGHLVVIGAGVIGLELGSVWSRLGSKVTVVEYLDRILPGIDSEIAKDALRIFRKQGLEFRLGQAVQSARVEPEGCVVECADSEPLRCDRVLLATGRIPNTDGLELSAIGVEVDSRGRIPVNGHFETAAPGVFAIGDVIKGPMLAHKAEEEGVACVERLVNGYGHVDPNTIPSVVYTAPEIAQVGKTEEELIADGVPHRIGRFPLMANGRARAIGSIEGKVKICAHAQTDRILGVQIIGAHAGDLIAEATTAMSFGASSEDLARTCHAHPTLSEVLKEAALAVDERPIHI